MSDAVDDAYERFLLPHRESGEEPEEKIVCPSCESENVDRSRGYRGEYRCLDCRHFWQVGGRYAS